ncbi:MAG: anthranilate synthase component I, partial [Candidatus Omnitrophica bacterium]|nr:anthranilate synthase component I [Candidatus Omnitrophota bacterium]
MNKKDYFPNKKEFKRLAKKGNLIPVYKEFLADYETPVSAYSKIDKSDYSFLFESVEEQEKTGRYTFLGYNPSMIIKTKANSIEVIKEGRTKKYRISGNPLDEIKRLMSPFKFVKTKGLPRF